MTLETAPITAIREALPAVRASTYLNTGAYGPLPIAAYEAIAARQKHDLEMGRGRVGGQETVRVAQAEIRRDVARIVHAGEHEIAITHGTTAGMNAAVWGIDWRPGDELVISQMEHIGGLAAAYMLGDHRGVNVRFAPSADGAGMLAAIRAQVSPRTRAVVCSHVGWTTGFVFPVAEIVAIAHRAGALAVVDAAQAAGAIAVDVKALGVDAYAMPGQKWLCGPGGTGALYVSESALDRLHGSFAAHASFERSDELGDRQEWGNARRFEAGFGNRPLLFGMRASLRWLLDEVDLSWACRRVVELADYARARLAAVPGVTVTTPTGTRSGLTHFTFEGWELPAVVEELLDRDVVIRAINRPPGLRASTGFYNDIGDIDRLVAALREIHGLAPHPPKGGAHEHDPMRGEPARRRRPFA